MPTAAAGGCRTSQPRRSSGGRQEADGRTGCLPLPAVPEALPAPLGWAAEAEDDAEEAADEDAERVDGDGGADEDGAGREDSGVTSGPRECDGDAECDGVSVGDHAYEAEAEAEREGEWDGPCEGEVEGQCEGEAECDGEFEGEWDGEWDGACECDGEPEPEGRDAEVHGDVDGDLDADTDADVDGDAEPLGQGLQEVLGSPPGCQVPGGGGTRWSPWPWPPAGRVNQARSCWSYSTTTFTCVTDWLTTTTFSGRNDVHAVPVKLCGTVEAVGGRSGLPQAQRALGSPLPSISTAVPACSTAGKAEALPLLKP